MWRNLLVMRNSKGSTFQSLAQNIIFIKELLLTRISRCLLSEQFLNPLVQKQLEQK